jgi:hypothetical protein
MFARAARGIVNEASSNRAELQARLLDLALKNSARRHRKENCKETKGSNLRFFAAKAAKHVLSVSSRKRWNYSNS